MGQYLRIGIATKIRVSKERRFDEDLTYEQIVDDLKETINIDNYNIINTKNNVIFELKNTLIEKHAMDLILEQLEIYETKANFERKKKELQRFNKDLLKKLNEVGYSTKIDCFFLDNGGFYINDVSYISKCGATCYADMIVFICEGKILMECYFDVFRYLRQKIIESTESHIKDSIMITIG
ncbi:MAG: hypothetical protein IJ809_02650 [Clostridia bacterium]|nr:hypothetical protein [Clostridia bacterium]